MLTNPQNIAIVDALLSRMEGKRQTIVHKKEPEYTWTITSKKHCDLASALLAMVPPKEEVRPWPKWKKEQPPIHQPLVFEYGYPF